MRLLLRDEPLVLQEPRAFLTTVARRVPGASIIATLYRQPEQAAIFAYERGATMDYETLAPARRVMFFLSNDTFTNLFASGRALFDAAVDWAATPPAQKAS